MSIDLPVTYVSGPFKALQTSLQSTMSRPAPDKTEKQPSNKHDRGQRADEQEDARGVVVTSLWCGGELAESAIEDYRERDNSHK